MLLPIVDEPDASPSHANPRRVLIVENDPDSLRVLQAGLAQSGFIVTTLKRGEDALTTIDHHRPHLVMLDFEFPGIVTDKLIRQIRRHVPTDRPRLLALSLYSSEQQIVSVFELGVDDYVVRPIPCQCYWPECARSCGGLHPPLQPRSSWTFTGCAWICRTYV